MEISPDLEHLRETLFYKIFKEALLVPTKNDIAKVKDFCCEKGDKVPRSIFSSDGYSVSADGLFSKMPTHLDYIFGEQNVLASKRYQDATKGWLFYVLFPPLFHKDIILF